MKNIFRLPTLLFLTITLSTFMPYSFFDGFFIEIRAETRVEINTASIQDLDKITGIGPTLAQRIVDGRPFSYIDDLLRVKGIGEKTLQKIKDQGLAYVEGQTQVTQTPPETPPTQAIVEQPPTITYQSGIFINEILPSPEGIDETNEFIEICNSNNFEVSLDSWQIKDVEGTTQNYTFPENSKIQANGYLVVKRPETKILLNNDKDGLNLMWPDGQIVSQIYYERAIQKQSFNKIGSDFKWSATITPGATNIITAYLTKNEIDNLPEQKKSDNNIAIASIKDSINVQENYKNTVNNIEKNISEGNNPWIILFTSITVIITSGGIILFFNFKK